MISESEFTFFPGGVESAKRAAKDAGVPLYVSVQGWRGHHDYYTIHPDGVVVAMKLERMYRPVGNTGVTS